MIHSPLFLILAGEPGIEARPVPALDRPRRSRLQSSLVIARRSQGAKEVDAQTPVPDSDHDHVKERNEWFYRGRIVHGLPSAQLRRRTYQSKMGLRKQRATALTQSPSQTSFSTGSWIPLGPVPLASDASGNGTQDYH